MSKVLFIVQQLSQPRCLKRIEDVASSGFDYEVYGFNNGLYDDNIKDSKINISHIRIIDKKTKKIFKIREYYNLVKYVLSVTQKNDILYCFGFELGAICSLINYSHRFIYEEADISASRFTNFFIKNTLICLDKWIIKRSILTIFTSRGFAQYLFNNKPFDSEKIIFIENKLHNYFQTITRKPPKKINLNNITFGFVGLIRYPNTILRFAKIVATLFPQHNFYFFGDFDGVYIDFEEWNNYKNIKFWGKFRNPIDLENIYKEIDINIACYDIKSENVKIAEPNKLYESMFFLKPLIVSSNTYLANRINEFNAGFSIDASNDDCIINFINGLKSDNIESIINSVSLIPKNELISNSKELIIKISKILNQ